MGLRPLVVAPGDATRLIPLVPRLCLGTSCSGGSASRTLEPPNLAGREAEPRRQWVPRQSLGTRGFLQSIADFVCVCRIDRGRELFNQTHREFDMTERELFVAALHLRDAARVAFLDLACDDRAVRSRVDSLLLEHERLGGFLEPSAAPGEAALDPNATTDLPGEHLDTVIAGKYKLMELIGEGGMGSVWRAQQTEPVKRFVAVKLIKSGMDSKAVLARFEAERQALAVMD